LLAHERINFTVEMTMGADDDRRHVASGNATKTQSDGGPTRSRGPAWTGLRVAVPVYVYRTAPKPEVGRPSRGAETTPDPDDPIEPGGGGGGGGGGGEEGGGGGGGGGG
jgi:hypothetical protein